MGFHCRPTLSALRHLLSINEGRTRTLEETVGAISVTALHIQHVSMNFMDSVGESEVVGTFGRDAFHFIP